ncbi:YihY/virulence factor BrkB family protein [Phenylobacterium sp.]|uniref:YihY/virulence factor BrkB family protein n=1 Tax=Phenylobacterium sp. TaxID=1871053 RepID=UPI002C4AE27B|nr:YihY/virulence factor BrkB family protein [Phenylobacterium sp.]HLZ75695.1 YihY/virulence factor BrkB family protein [Phenylobacterium sp.]
MTASQTPARAPRAPHLRFGRWSAFLAGAAAGLATVAADGVLLKALKLATVQPADDVAEVSARSWKLIARRTLKEFTEDRIPAVAAGSAFYALLALFPALGVFVSLYGLVGDLQGAQRQIADLQGLLPAGGVSVLSEQIARLAITSHASLGLTFLVSLLLSVWTSNAGMKGLIGGLNVAYECKEKRNFFVLNLVSLTFTAGAILFTTAAMAAVVAAPEVLSWLGLRAWASASLLRWPAMFLVAVGALSILYRFAPSRPHARWRWITPGGVLAAVAWMGMSVAFSAYVGRFGSYDRTYGSLGAIVGFMTWIWLSLTIVLAGAEFNSELEDQVGAEP